MKFISSDYDKETGISTVTIEYKKEKFTGTAKLHPEDKDSVSEVYGGTIAETRAIIKALKKERKVLIEEAEVCRKFIKACSQCKNWDKESSTAKVAYRQLNLKIKAANKKADEINNAYAYLIKKQNLREKTLKKMSQNKLKDNPQN